MVNISLLDAIYLHSLDGIILVNEAGVIESVNPAVTTIFGYQPAEVTGKNLALLIPQPYDLEVVEAVIRQNGNVAESSTKEIEGKRKDGSLFPFLLTASRITLTDKNVSVFMVHDLSKQRLAEDAMLVSENKINAIIQSAVDGIITIDERGIIEMANPSACKLFGYTPEELIGKNVNILMPQPEKSQHDSYIRNYKQTGVGKIIGIGREVTGARKDGSTFPFYLSISEVHLADRRVFTGFIHDISEQKISEERLRRYAAELERSNLELQDFAYVSSHDLQEPLRKIQAFGDRLKMKDAANLSDRGKDYIDRMLNAAYRMQNLINDLLSFSRVTTKAQPFTKVDLNVLLQEVLSDLEISISQTHAEIHHEPLPVIEAEPTQMRQLFQNLITNAIKFRKDTERPVITISSRHIQRKAHLTSTPGDEVVEIHVADNGIGFDEKYLDRIFNVFQRLEGHRYEGSGIGLAICRKIAIRHGGNITARSQIGKGSVFIVTLALKQPREKSSELQKF